LEAGGPPPFPVPVPALNSIVRSSPLLYMYESTPQVNARNRVIALF